MERDVYGSETAHGETANSPMLCISDCAIVRINIFDQVDGNICLNVLVMIESIAPLTCLPWTSIPIGQNQDEFGYFAKRNQGVSRLIRFATSKPVAIIAR